MHTISQAYVDTVLGRDFLDQANGLSKGRGVGRPRGELPDSGEGFKFFSRKIIEKGKIFLTKFRNFEIFRGVFSFSRRILYIEVNRKVGPNGKEKFPIDG